MATETLYPDAIITQTGLSGAVSTIASAEDGTWMTSNASGSTLRVSFPTPSGDPNTGTGLQSFRFYLRKNAAGGGDPQIDSVELYENGTLRQTLVTQPGSSITSATGEVFTDVWNAANLVNGDGSGVELRIVCSKGGGGPNERNAELDSVSWIVDYTAPVVVVDSGTVSGSGTGTTSASAILGRVGSATAAGAGTSAASASATAIAASTAAGVGTSTSSALAEAFAVSTTAGAGSTSSVGLAVVLASSTAAGSGSTTASGARVVFGVGAASAGLGTTTASGETVVVGSSTAAGVGSSTSLALVSVVAAGSGSGLGTGSSSGLLVVPAAGSGVGAGSASGAAFATKFSSSTASGIGTSLASGARVLFASATGAGVGTTLGGAAVGSGPIAKVLSPTGTVLVSGLENELGGTTNLHLSVDDPFGSEDDDSTYVVNTGRADAVLTLDVTNMFGNFDSMDSISVRVRARVAP